MDGIMLRPDLKTAGGEVCDIVRDGEFVGVLTLVYRESDRLSGSIQLERQVVSAEDKQNVYAFLQKYVQNLVDALHIKECEVLVTYSDYDYVIATNHALQPAVPEEVQNHLGDEDTDYDWVKDDTKFDDFDPNDSDEIGMVLERSDELGYDLVIVSEKRNRVDYHIYDQESELIAEASLHMYGNDVVGDIEWRFDPFEEEMNHVTELLVSDFNEDEVDTFVFNMNYNGETIDTIELTHMDLLEAADEEYEWSNQTAELDRDDYSIILARDDGDTLTYEIYQQSYGGLPIGTATVDISHRQLTGFIDFREPGSSDDRELIAALLLEELDKEKDYETVNLSMLYRNKLIDEILFETDTVH